MPDAPKISAPGFDETRRGPSGDVETLQFTSSSAESHEQGGRSSATPVVIDIHALAELGPPSLC